MQPTSIDSQPTIVSIPLNDKTQKKIKNAGQSSFLLGILLTLIGLLGLGVLVVKGGAIYALISSIIFVILYLIITVSGNTLKKTNDIVLAQSKISLILILSIIAIVIAILDSILSQKGIGLAAILTIVLVIYLVVVKSQIKKLA